MNYSRTFTDSPSHPLYQQNVEFLRNAIVSHPKWKWKRGMATKQGGTVIFVSLNTVSVSDPTGNCTFYSKPRKNEIQTGASVRKSIEDLSNDLSLDGPTTGILLQELIESPAIEEVMLRKEPTEGYQLTVFYSGGPVVYEGSQKGPIVAQALYEAFSAQSNIEGVEHEQEN